MGFSRQEYWSGLPLPSPGDRSDKESNSGLLHCRRILYQLELVKVNINYILQVRIVKQKGGQGFTAIRARKTPQVCLTLRSTHFLNGIQNNGFKQND